MEDTLFGVDLRILEFAASLASAAGTLLAVVVALYLARRGEKPRLCVGAGPLFMSQNQEGKIILKCTGLVVLVENISLRQIGIERVEMQSGMFNFWPFVQRHSRGLVESSSTGKHFGIIRNAIIRFPDNKPYMIIEPGKIQPFEIGRDN